jgi:DNA-binding CsgD family transcriptional regulator
MTPCAQALLGEGRALELVGGRLRARSEGPDLTSAIRRQANGGDEGATLLIPVEAGPALVLDITPLLREDWAARLPVRVLVTSRGRPAVESRPEPVLQASFGLTFAEAEVAISLARGGTPIAIAAERRVSVETVRSQIRNLYLKVGVGHRAALTARLAALV